jgi:hypothetical protein
MDLAGYQEEWLENDDLYDLNFAFVLPRPPLRSISVTKYSTIRWITSMTSWMKKQKMK